jgi:formate--tetrahydrofolate ligase
LTRPTPPDLEIAQQADLKPITEIADSIGIAEDELEVFGRYKAKVSAGILDRLSDAPLGKYIDVTAITPTPLGEGKTVTTVGLSQGLAKIGKNTFCCIRQPSLGPVFGIKGGAAGGGYSQVIPMEDFNLHLTGDFHAVTAAHNLLAAMTDTLTIKGNPGGLDPLKITWRRCMDINDGPMRNIIIGLNGHGVPRETGFDLTSASEVMAILALSTSLKDLRERLGKVIIGFRPDNSPVTAEDIKAAGAMAVLLKDALNPNLLQTLEHVPTFVHCGPFANIAHGNSSILADQIALRLADYVVTESGFGADMGMEKFFNIKCRRSGLVPSAVCLVATVRALKAHSGRFRIVAGKPLDQGLIQEDLDAIEAGCENLDKQIENANLFGVPCVVAVNRFATDTDAEIDLIKRRAREVGALDAVVSNVHSKGGEGGRELAEAVVSAAESGKGDFRFLYNLNDSVEKKIETIATKIYGAAGVSFEPLAKKNLATIKANGWDKLPICMAKTHLSLSHDPNLKGRPRDFVAPIREIRFSVGAGFLYPLLGTMMTMPALGSKPAAMNIDIDENGKVLGLF